MTHLALIATGGTIACTTVQDGSLVPTVTGAQLAADIDAEVVEFRQLDSSSITLADLDELIAVVNEQTARADIDGVIITHGSDSMEETAMALEIFCACDTPIVLTGAQRSYDHPHPDGPRNLRDARKLALSKRPGVFICFGGMIVPARGARKQHTFDLRAFESLRVSDATPRLQPRPMAPHPVEIIPAYPGAGRVLVDAARTCAAGFVIEAMGAVNTSRDMGRALADALHDGLPVVISTRTPYGATALSYGGDGGGASLHSLGAINAGSFRPSQARILLAAALATGTDPAEVFRQNPDPKRYVAI
ncbi:asparaginase [Corynebacterium macginleyi]|uniref:asparaginase n=1 Tax=Corynebacterium macginleyi TaxID=38290 RepID=UPI00190A16FA|nr:asparaginase [Corynebacterium macginleyi]MBK4147578.1 asparaginase [Corynebacterium macginleyi]MBK4159687.1 asparaginase [Corynebacterium macginleyi]